MVNLKLKLGLTHYLTHVRILIPWKIPHKNQRNFEIVCYYSLINNGLIKKITESTNYGSIHLLDMFWKIFVSKVDKIPSLKITNKNYL